MTATCACSLKRLINSAPFTSMMRADPCALSVRTGSCQPCHDRAHSHAFEHDQSSPAVTSSPVAKTASYSRASCSMPPPAPVDQLVGDTGHGRHHNGDVVTRIDLPLDVVRHVTDAIEIEATDVPPNFITSLS